MTFKKLYFNCILKVLNLKAFKGPRFCKYIIKIAKISHNYWKLDNELNFVEDSSIRKIQVSNVFSVLIQCNVIKQFLSK